MVYFFDGCPDQMSVGSIFSLMRRLRALSYLLVSLLTAFLITKTGRRIVVVELHPLPRAGTFAAHGGLAPVARDAGRRDHAGDVLGQRDLFPRAQLGEIG